MHVTGILSDRLPRSLDHLVTTTRGESRERLGLSARPSDRQPERTVGRTDTEMHPLARLGQIAAAGGDKADQRPGIAAGFGEFQPCTDRVPVA